MFLSNGVGAEVRDDSLIFGQLTSVHFRRIDRRPNFRDKKSERKNTEREITKKSAPSVSRRQRRKREITPFLHKGKFLIF